MTEVLVEFDDYESLTGLIARANELNGDGKNAESAAYIVKAEELIRTSGLSGLVAIQETPYAGGKIFRLSGFNNGDFAYYISGNGVIFEAS